MIGNISGYVKIKATLTGGANAVTSGVCFGGKPRSVQSPALWLRTRPGGWPEAYGADGYSVADNSQSIPSHASFPVLGSEGARVHMLTTTRPRQLLRFAPRVCFVA